MKAVPGGRSDHRLFLCCGTGTAIRSGTGKDHTGYCHGRCGGGGYHGGSSSFGSFGGGGISNGGGASRGF